MWGDQHFNYLGKRVIVEPNGIRAKQVEHKGHTTITFSSLNAHLYVLMLFSETPLEGYLFSIFFLLLLQ